jgi:hypothetical protein
MFPAGSANIAMVVPSMIVVTGISTGADLRRFVRIADHRPQCRRSRILTNAPPMPWPVVEKAVVAKLGHR